MLFTIAKMYIWSEILTRKFYTRPKSHLKWQCGKENIISSLCFALKQSNLYTSKKISRICFDNVVTINTYWNQVGIILYGEYIFVVGTFRVHGPDKIMELVDHALAAGYRMFGKFYVSEKQKLRIIKIIEQIHHHHHLSV